MKIRLAILAAMLASAFTVIGTTAKDKTPPKKEPIPHAQDQPPGPPLSPQEALKKMQVPPGFRVELVAAEPDIVNPVAMTFDERGRIWITESIEYPKRAAGPGKDRVKLLESTKGDGKFDKITTVIDGLNIPSGIAIGHGGVWVANSPDILFYPFEDFANAKLGKPQVVVTGFGRHDTHELPNSLTWGPDGWLYGLNGVFNRSVIKQDGKTFDFTCALFRIHPKTKKFEIFCEGTSNPWGLAFNENGDAFVSACVIDHLWHLTETGYYQRQGGPYPPFTWKIGSIVKHRHQKAAYCGLCWFDSDAYPPEYREKLYMGNIHGGAINCDQLEKDGSTYSAKPGLSPGTAVPGAAGSNFLVANDAWFMPVSQKVGPDGCMYILDWYDRYHCYQDANRDPAGIDRLRGRLYRVVYKEAYTPATTFDMSKETDGDLIKRLRSINIFDRETAQRILTERCARALKRYDLQTFTYGAFGLSAELQKLALDETALRKTRLHAFWIVVGSRTFDGEFLGKMFIHKDATFRAIGVRAAGSRQYFNFEEHAGYEKLLKLVKDSSPDVQLQLAIAIRKLRHTAEGKDDFVSADAMPVLLDVLTHCGDDKLIPHIVWQNLHPLLEKDGDRFLTLAAKIDLAKSPGLAKVLPRAIDRILGNPSGDPAAVIKFLEPMTGPDMGSKTASLCLNALTAKVQNGEIAEPALDKLKKGLAPLLPKFMMPGRTSTMDAALLSATLGDAEGIVTAKSLFERGKVESIRLRSLDALLVGRPAELKDGIPAALGNEIPDMPTFRGQVLGKLGKLNDPWVAATVLDLYPKFTPDEQARSIELLTQRPAWAKSLFKEIADKKISKDVVNINQARRLLGLKDAELTKLVEKHWGTPRNSRDPDRERVVAQMRELYKKTPGDAKAGIAVFKKLCAHCHKIYGEGVEVGPDLTSNGRSDFDQLLSNIFDPSLVIGAGYNAVIVNTKQGQTLSGLLVEDNPQRVVLKVQGGELKTIARKDVDEQFTSKVSMMPEDLEKQLRPQEIADLLSYLSLDRPPSDPKAKRIPGTPR
jgi:putative membrane-bound dehydrogenase-like protein